MITCSDGARLVGYARVSTQDQDLALQIDALLQYGVAKELIFTDKASGAKHQRPGLDTCVDQLRGGDVLLVWRLDRLGRSVRHHWLLPIESEWYKAAYYKGGGTNAGYWSLGLNPIIVFAIRVLSRKTLAAARKHKARYEYYFVHADGEQLREVARLVESGAITPLVDKGLPARRGA